MVVQLEQLIDGVLKNRPSRKQRGPQIEILHEDSGIVAVNKPAGITSVPGRVEWQDTYYHVLKEYFERREGEHFTPKIIHRLDKQTSGLMVVGKHTEAERVVAMQFERHEAAKEYLAVVGGEVAENEGEIDLCIQPSKSDRGRMVTDPVHGKEAVTKYEILDRFRGFTLMMLRPLTGRTHQIRVHMAAFGHPVVADGVYGSGQPVCLSEFKKGYKPRRHRAETPLIARQALHAWRMTFVSPETHAPLTLEAPLPHDLALLLKQLDKYAR